MQISYSFLEDKLLFSAEPNADDINYFADRKGKMRWNNCEFVLPESFDKEGIHPDALALLAILIYGPFTKKNIELSWGVSRDFSNSVLSSFKRKIAPVDSTLKPRTSFKGSRPALAFSGGVDSFSALNILPDDTVPVFCHRTRPAGVPVGMYRADAALRACDNLKSDYDVVVIETDMEFVRDPVGFAVDWTNAAGAVLISDMFNINSISFGMIMESAYFLGHPHYSDLKKRSVYSAWAPIFEAVGLPISLPTSGLSEVLTSKMAAIKGDTWSAQSCVRGNADEPCMRCFKCFRKTILDSRLTGDELPSSHFDMAIHSKEVKNRLLQTPIHHEDVLAFSLIGLNCEPNPILDALQQKVMPIFEYGSGLKFLEKLYPKSRELVPDFLWAEVSENISCYAGTCSESEIQMIEKWDVIELTTNDRYIQAQSKLLELLN
ncbi:DUF6395 domain-containing protein [Loktanella sp. DJP18]|uniref:DUF6395 domain-containing protein n=1 Tax=Loktanella sp. DJP18 TaxID=3409788 RepID=UPI003BB4A803